MPPFLKPVLGMKIASTAELSCRAVITCIQTDNNNKTSWNFQADQTGGLEQCGLNKAGIKQAQKQVQQVH